MCDEYTSHFQKDHWIHHMHVCKNDVKKKAAESSENEPPVSVDLPFFQTLKPHPLPFVSSPLLLLILYFQFL